MKNKFIYEVFDIKVNDNIYNRIFNKSFIENKNISIDDLVYIKFLHYDYENKIKEGELIINRKILNKVINILEELFNEKYQINSFKLIDEYFGNNEENRSNIDRKSILDNNSSGFFYRKIYKTNTLSKHSYGFAIDINPKENPYLPYINGKYDYANLTEEEIYYLNNRNENIPHIITHNDLLYKLFIKNGFKWGGDWKDTKDYQHFEVEYE